MTPTLWTSVFFKSVTNKLKYLIFSLPSPKNL